MRALFLLPLLLSLSGCGALANMSGGPQTAANQTVLDEKLATGVELAYQAAGQAVLSINTVRPFSPELKERVKAADRKAYEAVVAVRAAYAAGNASSYSMAAAQAQTAIVALLALIS